MKRYPFLRLLLPLAAGIWLGDTSPLLFPESLYAAFVLLVSLLPLYRWKRFHRFFGAVAYLLFFFVGFHLMSAHWNRSAFTFSSEKAVYEVRIREHPEEKQRSILCRCLLPDGKQFLLYFPKDSLAYALRRGDELRVYTRLAPATNLGDSAEFDYVRYLRRHGVCGTAYVPAGCWQVVGHDTSRTLLQVALDYRKQLVAFYQQLGFQGDELTVLSALTVGDREELSEEIEQTYTKSGAAHILALSGMHVALLFGLLWFVLQPLWNRVRRMRPLMAAGIISCLWAFAFFTGLSSSVVRAVVMCTIFTLSKLQWEKPLTMNTLLATAFFMLLVRPEWLFDVGFQLSFASVAAILLVQPRLEALWKVENRVLRYLWRLFTISVAAQIGVAPLIVFYFHNFATHFLLTNLLVVPLSTIILYAALCLLLLTLLPALQQLFAAILAALISFQNAFLRWVEQLPYASLEGLYMDEVELVLFYASFFAFGYACRRRTAKSIHLFLWIVLGLLSWHVCAIL